MRRVFALLALSASALAAPAKVDFDREIRGLLADNCTQCHGPDEAKRKGDRRIDTREGALAESNGVRAIVPGHPEQSDLIARVLSKDPEDIMPPPKSKKKPLSAAQVELLKRWIAEGAEYRGHWSLEPVKAPATPQVKDPKWARNEIDRFILARLERENLPPSPEADRYTLLRRLSLDLTGLPPTPEEMSAFLADKSADAYEKQVDRLLSSPHFGERWGRHWLDLARYADSDGYEKDLVRPYAYLFRDWVIDAFNRDLPFDRFTVEQLAGDLRPGATEAEKIATGFHRQTLTNREGGVDKEEFRCKATVDRASTTGTVWLGLSVGCAECHTHKFDPITQKEFYQFYSFFNNASERDIPAPQPEELARYETELAAWQKKVDAVEKPFRAYLAHVTPATIAAWEGSVPLPPEHWTVLKPQRVAAIMEGAEEQFNAQADGSIIARDRDAVRTRYRLAFQPPAGTTGFRLEVIADPGKNVGDAKDGGFGLSEFYGTLELPSGETKRINFQRAAVDFADDPKAAEHLIDNDRTTHWTVNAKAKESHVAVAELAQPLEIPAGARFELHLEFFTVGVMNHFRISATDAAGPFTPDTTPDKLREILEMPLVFRPPAHWRVLQQHYAEKVDPDGQKLNAALAAELGKKPKPAATAAAILVADSRPTHIHIRGDFLQKGDEVQPGTFAALPPLHPRGAKADRLDLARWLTSEQNPLTPRVRVNHIWRHLFGRGLVATENDFGTRGDKPTHPELLDWLAAQFRDNDRWSQKAFISRIVNSATYRQASHWRKDVEERDPLNTLLARQGRYRLEAEVVRDVSLSVSGLLTPKIGGPSIKPPLPPDLAALNYAGGLKWQTTTGPEQYRRGLYIHFQRTVPYPMLMTFDAPESSTACTRRERSNTPLQALTLLNNGTSLECAQAFGRRLAETTGGAPELIRRGFELALNRPPLPMELSRLQSYFEQQQTAFQQDPDGAAKFIGLAKPDPNADPIAPATLTALSRVLLNLDELITRE
jgi:hypothetical protein